MDEKKILHKNYLFWDVGEVDPKEHERFVIKRILSYGDLEDIRWAFDFYGKEKIKEVFLESAPLDKKSDNFWCFVFNVDPAICTKRQSIIKQRML